MEVNDYAENWPSGWIKLYRSIRSHWIFKNPEYLRAWIIMLLEVNYKPEKVLLGKTLFDCNRGQKLYSLDTWAKKFGNWSIQNVRTFFRLLQKDNMIIHENIKKSTRITICNFDTYQMHLTDSQQTANNQLTDSQQQLKKDNKEKKVKNIIYPFSSDVFLFPVYKWLY